MNLAVQPWPSTKGHVFALSPLSPLGWGGEWKEKGKKLMDQDKGCLTEQQTKQTVTTILMRRIYKTSSEMHKRCPALSGAAINFPPASSPTQNPACQHVVSNTLFCLASLGQLAQLCPLLDSGEN